MKLKENQEKKPHPGIEPEFNKSSVCMERNSSTPIPLGHIAVDIRSVITCTVQVNRYCIVAFPPSQISPRKTGYIVAFPPENWLYSSLSPGEILLYSQISPFL